MKTAFVIYDGVTALDFIGVYDSLSRIKSMGFDDNFHIDICGLEQTVKDSTGKIAFNIEKVGQNLKSYDMVIIPGGLGTRRLINDENFISYIKTANPNGKLISVCNGALILGKAGFLNNKNITTHHNLLSCIREYGCNVVDKRVVADGNIITAAGVTAGIDLGLYLCAMLYNKDIMFKIAKQMEYSLSEDFEEELF